MITNHQSGTNVHEISDGIFRINTPVTHDGFRFNFNQYVIIDDEPLLFHTGPRKLFPLVHEALAAVMPVSTLRYVSFSHIESDECGSLNQWLEVAPQAVPLCGQVAAMVSVADLADRAPVGLAHQEQKSLGSRNVRWLDTPHVPHGWECGLLFDEKTSTLFCGDLFTQPGTTHPALTTSDILSVSEAFRLQMDYYAHGPNTRDVLSSLIATKPRTLACMHGSAWSGDGAALLSALAEEVAPNLA